VLRSFLRALPEFIRMVARLVRDPLLPRRVKVILAAAIVYLLSPLDLLPDLVPVLGYLDDVVIGAVAVDGILSHVDRALVLRYWPGSPDALEKIARVARLLSVWLPRRVKQRLFGTGR
jgi:uncharacterized membrane protein YkvA (DUF1232 family)